MCLAVPGQLLSVEHEDDPLVRQGRVAFSGIMKEVSLACVPEAKPGDFVLVHAGFAICVIDQEEAAKTLAYLAECDPEVLG